MSYYITMIKYSCGYCGRKEERKHKAYLQGRPACSVCFENRKYVEYKKKNGIR